MDRSDRTYDEPLPYYANRPATGLHPVGVRLAPGGVAAKEVVEVSGTAAKKYKEGTEHLAVNSLAVANRLRAHARASKGGELPYALQQALPFSVFGAGPTAYMDKAPGQPLATIPGSVFAENFERNGGVGTLFESLIAHLVEAAVFMNEAGVGHGDLHARNIMFDLSTGRASIVDWDLARFDDSQATRDRMWKDVFSIQQFAEQIAKEIQGRVPAASRAAVAAVLGKWMPMLPELPARRRRM